MKGQDITLVSDEWVLQSKPGHVSMAVVTVQSEGDGEIGAA